MVILLFKCIPHPQENGKHNQGKDNPTSTEKGKQESERVRSSVNI